MKAAFFEVNIGEYFGGGGQNIEVWGIKISGGRNNPSDFNLQRSSKCLDAYNFGG